VPAAPSDPTAAHDPKQPDHRRYLHPGEAAQLGRARLAVSSASALLAPGMAARIANPPAEAIELCRALVSAFAEAGSDRTPEAAADVWLHAARKLQN